LSKWSGVSTTSASSGIVYGTGSTTVINNFNSSVLSNNSTFIYWIYYNSLNIPGCLLSIGRWNGNYTVEFVIFGGSNMIDYNGSYGLPNDTLTLTTQPLNQWYHVAYVKSTNGANQYGSIYINGALATVKGGNNPVTATTSINNWNNYGLIIGTDAAGYGQANGCLNGNISKFNWYSVALSASDISNNFNATRGQYGV
jgi:hypothetical protein